MLTRLALLPALLCLLMLSSRSFAQPEDLYQGQCASCHATDGEPTEAGKRLGAADLKSPFVQGLTNEELFKSIAFADNHKGYPHAFIRRGMTDQEVYDLVSFVRQMAAQNKRRIPKRK
jgi:mono/diheme cytochrome c family protein